MTDDQQPAADALVGRLELSAPATPEIMDLVHGMIEHLWTTHPDIGERDRARFEMSVIEILGNIVEHAYAAEETHPSTRRFQIALAATEDRLVARLADNGLPVGLDLSGAVMPDELAESGRGLALATAALDDLGYHRVGDRNLWDLLCLRGSSA
ncbi:ATP-binding protein [Nocardioides sp. 503]|uniref:ATP-binding protein n=1 Tax=Nocardioides sp. 503 TaxID=2508326 RepID=UPI0010704305|nr:ATP-binding protein [Nocardioides sp. 503]